jgi:hypothetical protein
MNNKYTQYKLLIKGINRHLGTDSGEQTVYSYGCDDRSLREIHRQHFRYWPTIVLLNVEEA